MIGQTVSHYRILKKLGEGGMGEVYLAEDTSLKRKVALKFLPASLADDEIAHKRFLREAQSAAALDHPFICHIHEVAQTDDGQDFIVMEYVEGLTLKDRLADGPLALKEALTTASEVAEALEKAHKAGDSRGTTILLLIQKMYAVERKATEDGASPEERLKCRLQHSAPVYEEIFRLLDEWAPQVPHSAGQGHRLRS